MIEASYATAVSDRLDKRVYIKIGFCKRRKICGICVMGGKGRRAFCAVAGQEPEGQGGRFMRQTCARDPHKGLLWQFRSSFYVDRLRRPRRSTPTGCGSPAASVPHTWRRFLTERFSGAAASFFVQRLDCLLCRMALLWRRLRKEAEFLLQGDDAVVALPNACFGDPSLFDKLQDDGVAFIG